MKQNLKKVFKSFTVELAVYSVLVVLYVLLVLHFLGDWLAQLFREERKLYAAVALVLIIGQGYFLELITRALLGTIKGKKEE
jgi:hypothetical protein